MIGTEKNNLLSLFLNNIFCSDNSVCEKCNDESLILDTNFGPFMFLYVKEQNNKYLHSLPNNIVINNKQLVLIGLIGRHIHSITNDHLYVAYCKSVYEKNNWYEHNSIKKHTNRLTSIPAIEVCILVYIKCE